MPIQMCPIEIPDNYEFVRLGTLKGGANEPYIERSDGQLRVWEKPYDSAGHYIILRKVEPVPKYIPFTAETFRPHRDRWVRWKDTMREWRVSWCDPDGQFGHTQGAFRFDRVMDNLEFINADGTTEPFGQKVEG